VVPFHCNHSKTTASAKKSKASRPMKPKIHLMLIESVADLFFDKSWAEMLVNRNIENAVSNLIIK